MFELGIFTQNTLLEKPSSSQIDVHYQTSGIYNWATESNLVPGNEVLRR